jgi:hypothetical protein
LVDVAVLPGHEKIETTAVYSQPRPRDLERAVERLAAPRRPPAATEL